MGIVMKSMVIKKYLQTAVILNFADVHIFKSGEYAIPFTSDRMIFANQCMHVRLRVSIKSISKIRQDL